MWPRLDDIREVRLTCASDAGSRLLTVWVDEGEDLSSSRSPGSVSFRWAAAAEACDRAEGEEGETPAAPPSDREGVQGHNDAFLADGALGRSYQDSYGLPRLPAETTLVGSESAHVASRILGPLLRQSFKLDPIESAERQRSAAPLCGVGCSARLGNVTFNKLAEQKAQNRP